MKENAKLKRLDREYRDALKKLSKASKHIQKYIITVPLETKLPEPALFNQMKKDLDIFRKVQVECRKSAKKYWNYKMSK